MKHSGNKSDSQKSNTSENKTVVDSESSSFSSIGIDFKAAVASFIYSKIAEQKPC